MENSYEIISGFNHRHFSSPQNNLVEKRNNSFNNKDRNNNSNNTRVVKNYQKNEFNPKKIMNKLELEFQGYDKSKRTDHALKLYSMQQMNHNVDLVIHTYIKKVFVFFFLFLFYSKNSLEMFILK